MRKTRTKTTGDDASDLLPSKTKTIQHRYSAIRRAQAIHGPARVRRCSHRGAERSLASISRITRRRGDRDMAPTPQLGKSNYHPRKGRPNQSQLKLATAVTVAEASSDAAPSPTSPFFP